MRYTPCIRCTKHWVHLPYCRCVPNIVLEPGTHGDLSRHYVKRKPVTNGAIQPQNVVYGSKFWIWEEERWYYLCSENKCADYQLRDRTSDLRLCFRIYAKGRFSYDAAHFSCSVYISLIQSQKTIRLNRCAPYITRLLTFSPSLGLQIRLIRWLLARALAF